MKTTLALLTFAAGLSQATAGTMNCTIQENGTTKQEIKVQHNYDETASHSFTQFDSAYATGFVAVSRGYGVVNIVSKDTGKSSSFYGKIGGGNIVGGTVYIGKAEYDSFSIECQ
jgi:hypothetical protein